MTRQLLASKKKMKTSRGIRNCNPLNIRRSTDQWKGMSEIQSDRSFVQFKSMEWGWRAAFQLLTRTYYHRYRLYTIRSIVNRWAPRTENSTDAYVAAVSRMTGIDPDAPLGIPSVTPTRWLMLGMAMAIMENGTAQPDGPASLDGFAMLRGWELSRAPDP